MISNQHGTALAFHRNGVLLIGPPGCGKSGLAMQLIRHGFDLVADDQVLLQPAEDGWTASCPEILQGKLHVRGVGFLDAAHRAEVLITCIFVSPIPAHDLSRPPALGVPAITLDFFRPDAPGFIIATLGNI